MRITLDSNAWEKVFDPNVHTWLPVREAITSCRLSAFICEAAFRIEAIQKRERSIYFAEPAMDVGFPSDTVFRGGKPYIRLATFGPDDTVHPGLPSEQVQKLNLALDAGVRLLRGLAWLGLPSPIQIRNPNLFETDKDGQSEREARQISIMAQIEARGVGKAIFDALGGWDGVHSNSGKRFDKACAEWADAELVAAHIAYKNDVLCTDDKARGTGASVFDANNRAWLMREYHVQFISLAELAEELVHD